MKTNVTRCCPESSNPEKSIEKTVKNRFFKVIDGRKQPVRGLWVRNGRYYARLAVEDERTGKKSVKRILIEDATTVPQAVEALKVLQVKRKAKDLPVTKRTPKFNEYVDSYLNFYKTVKDAKRESTMETESGLLKQWVKHLGETRLSQINKRMILAFIEERQGAGWSGRTVNLSMTVLRNVLKKAIDEEWLKRLPTENMRPLKWTPRKRSLLSANEMERLCEKALTTSKNGQQLADYLRLMSYCGSRMTETLHLKWSDVAWETRQITIGSDGLTKNNKARRVDFNAKLEAHLKDMFSRKAPDSDWLFPSPLRGDQDRAAKSFRESLLLARKAAKLPHVGFHDCRHLFISYCVMSGIDFMTIARWVGHQDGGVLIGKVYGHLSNEHTQLQAQRVVFGPSSILAAA